MEQNNRTALQDDGAGSSEDGRAETHSGDGGAILLVEDNEDNRAVYTTILRFYGYHVVEAESGEDGLVAAREIAPKLILMDVGLPGIDGWETTRRLKADQRTRDIPVIALTAHALPEHRAASFAAGCDGYLAKPVEPRDVLLEVTKYVAPTEGRISA